VWNVLHGVHLNVSKAMIITAYLLVACVTSEREKSAAQDNGWCSGNVAAVPTENDSTGRFLLVTHLFSN